MWDLFCQSQLIIDIRCVSSKLKYCFETIVKVNILKDLQM